ncbi:proline-rich protein 1 [Arabidopsis thaliana]|jgi:hypothetical protein|uniref:Proline-rich protein 1 n=3 Tax=Arabidopsis TaxID=3701 RepID=PRP1_ARATH|nr:proline-rich protein 1 [Arabidopsis thaliana]Q9FZ35.1 RecName: Full=Proline-rich protein 1; Short=AtPRP1; AltName: Full=Protein ROOT HAIR SPECIFIC 7; Flags: Precursor [Arabidopsis thaliana]KAG7657532.1 hypothetical protein ISN44_As01g045970 [Arabidopsis suecica]AAG00882.1 proline-rich protein 1 [Arabidopsis thaliana]AAG51112.1 proline-rich protein, putative [Arabidopsis thaliana]AEE33168.1 proline-rich protein 1 [Arabidopsis thaliana]CAA0295711.1 unnamed protein product [Arabidopsis thalia|eukprot:NP_175895.1 proline-rich protein 1 [Arabidopsis thaliana]
MAITRASFAICILLSLATIATADYYAPSSPPVYTSPVNKPTLPPPVYTPPVHKPTLPPPVYTPPVHKPTLSPPVYTKPTLPPPAYTPPVYNKPTLPAPVYTPPVYKPTLSPPVYTKPTLLPPVFKPTLSPPVYTKPTLSPTVYKPTLSPPVNNKPSLSPPVYKPTLSPPVYTKPTLPPPVYKKSPSYSPPPPFAPKPTYTPPTKPYVPEIIKAVGGIILCKNGYETYPIQGAKAKIVCSERGSYEKSKNEVVIYSDPTDFKGYFHVVLTHIKNLSNCRVKLYTSPVETCKNPTNVNKGLTGVPFSMYSDKNLKLFNVGPFYFTAGSKAAPATPRY